MKMTRILGDSTASKRARVLGLLLTGAFGLSLFGAGAAFAYWVTTDASQPATATADSLPTGNTPNTPTTSSPNSNSVSFTFTQAQSTSGHVPIPASDYTITRYPAGGGSSIAVVNSCSGTGTITCAESSVSDGSWVYTDTPIYGTNWVGAESAKSAAVTVDTTAPVVSATVIGQASNATIDSYVQKSTGYRVYANVTDAGFGVATVTANVNNVTTGSMAVSLTSVGGPFTSPGGATFTYRSALLTSNNQADGTVNYTVNAVDNVGNASAYSNNGSVTFDTTTPSETPTITGTLGSNGWYTSNVSVSWVTADAGSGVASMTGCTPSNVTSDTNGTTFTCSATDNVGNNSSQSVTIKRDATAPTDSLSVPSATNAFYNTGTGTLYFRGNTSGSFTLRDSVTDSTSPGSGPASANFPSFGVTNWTSSPGGTVATSGGVASNTYSWTSGAGTPGAHIYKSTDVAGNTSAGTTFPSAATPFVNDTTAPSVPAPTVTAGYYKALSVPVTLGTATDTGGSGVNSSTITVQRDQVALSGGSCGTFPGAFATTVTLVGGADTSVLSGFCYEYREQATDNVGNVGTSSASLVAEVDATSPTLSISSTGTGVSSSGSTVNFTSGGSGTFTLTATDLYSGISAATFPTITGWSQGSVTTTTTTKALTYTLGAASASAGPSVSATSGAGTVASLPFTITVNTPVTFSSSGTYTISIPAGTTTVNYTIAGGGGGGGATNGGKAGGAGGSGTSITGTITLAAHASAVNLNVVVAGGGIVATSATGVAGGSGIASGGASGSTASINTSSSGGGASGFEDVSTPLVVAAGGGGGGAGNSSVGYAGGNGDGSSSAVIPSSGVAGGGSGNGGGGAGGATSSGGLATGGAGGAADGGGPAPGHHVGSQGSPTSIGAGPGAGGAGGVSGDGPGGGGGGGGWAGGGGGGGSAGGNAGASGGGGSSYYSASGTTSGGVTYTITATASVSSNGGAAGGSGGSGSASFAGAGVTRGNSIATITSANASTFTVNSSSSFTVTTTGGYPTPAITNSAFGGCTPSTLPGTISFADNGDGTATISGTPTATGSYALCLNATNAAGTTTQSFTLTISTGVTFVGYGAAATTTSATTAVTVNYPAAATTGNFLLLILANSHHETASCPSGWASRSSVASMSGNEASLVTCYKFDAGETSVSVTSAGGAANGFSARVLAYSNVNTTTPFDTTDVTTAPATTGSSTFTPTGIMTATANSMAVSVVMQNDGAASSIPTLNFTGSGGNAQGFNFEGSNGVSSTSSNGAAAADKSIASASTAVTFPTWTSTVTTANKSLWIGISMVLRSP